MFLSSSFRHGLTIAIVLFARAATKAQVSTSLKRAVRRTEGARGTVRFDQPEKQRRRVGDVLFRVRTPALVVRRVAVKPSTDTEAKFSAVARRARVTSDGTVVVTLNSTSYRQDGHQDGSSLAVDVKGGHEFVSQSYIAGNADGNFNVTQNGTNNQLGGRSSFTGLENGHGIASQSYFPEIAESHALHEPHVNADRWLPFSYNLLSSPLPFSSLLDQRMTNHEINATHGNDVKGGTATANVKQWRAHGAAVNNVAFKIMKYLLVALIVLNGALLSMAAGHSLSLRKGWPEFRKQWQWQGEQPLANDSLANLPSKSQDLPSGQFVNEKVVDPDTGGTYLGWFPRRHRTIQYRHLHQSGYRSGRSETSLSESESTKST